MKLSIITICYNEVGGLQRTIQSVISQNFKDFEYIIIDGFSTDGSIEIIKQFEKNIDYWISELDDGIYNAMNKGLRRAKGEFVLFLNGGDYLYNDNVLSDVFMHKISQPIIYGYCITTNSKNSPTLFKAPEKLNKRKLIRRAIPHQATFIKRNIYERLGGFDEIFRIAGDYDFLLRAVIKNKLKTQYIHLLCAYFDRNGISSTYNDLRERERTDILNKYFGKYELLYYRQLNEFIDFLRRVKKELKKVISDKREDV